MDCMKITPLQLSKCAYTTIHEIQCKQLCIHLRVHYHDPLSTTATIKLLKPAILFILLTLVLPGFPSALADSTLPEMGETSANYLSAEQERQLASMLRRQIRRSLPLLEDAPSQDYINQLGSRLLSTLPSGSSQEHFTFFIIEDASINAFAMPGGIIAVHSGLILHTKSESELASVIAHEIAHVTQHHIARSYEQSQKSQIPITLAIMAAIVAGGTGNGEIMEAALASAIAGSQQKQLDFSREHEKEADFIGIKLLADAGFDPYSMPGFFQQLADSNKYGASIPEFLSTHPITENRLSESLDRASAYPKRLYPQSLSFSLARERVRVMSSKNSKELFTQTTAQIERSNASEVLRYRHALLLMANQKPSQARAILAALLKASPERLAYHLSYGEALKRSEDITRARQHLQQARVLFANNPALVASLAELMIEQQDYNAARATLLEAISIHADAAALYRLLSIAESKLGHPASSHGALAEYYRLRDDPFLSLEHIKLALKAKQENEYQTEKLLARKKQLQASISLEMSLQNQ